MHTSKSFKVDVTPEAHRLAKIYCAIRGGNIKDSVSNLIIQGFGKELTEFVDKPLNISNELISKEEKLYHNEIPYDRPFLNIPITKEAQKYRDDLKANSQTNSSIDRTKIEFHEANFGSNNQVKVSSALYRICQSLKNEPNEAQTPEEITKALPEISVYTTRRALYWLLKKGFVDRKLRENTSDRRKNSWEYWKLISSSVLEEKGFSFDILLQIIPKGIDQAISIRELAFRLNIPQSTIRDAINKLEQGGKVISIKGVNHKNQTTVKYYRSLASSDENEIAVKN